MENKPLHWVALQYHVIVVLLRYDIIINTRVFSSSNFHACDVDLHYTLYVEVRSREPKHYAAVYQATFAFGTFVIV